MLNVTNSYRPRQIATRLLRMCALKGGVLCRPEPAGRYNNQGVSDPRLVRADVSRPRPSGVAHALAA